MNTHKLSGNDSLYYGATPFPCRRYTAKELAAENAKRAAWLEHNALKTRDCLYYNGRDPEEGRVADIELHTAERSNLRYVVIR